MRRRWGFTLVELLTVVMIIAVLAMLLLPAVQSARESARMTLCRNNLLQLGIALGNYASFHGVLPPGVVEDRGPVANVPAGYHVGWAVQILPFLEQGNHFRHFDFHQGVYTDSHATVVAARIKVFLCPSNPRSTTMNYAGCHHDVEAPIDADNHGVLYRNSHLAYDEITDGLAYTILLGEYRDRAGLGWASGTRSSLRNTGHPVNGSDPVTALTSGWPDAPSGGPPDPDVPEPSLPNGLPQKYYVGGFSSWHPYGAHFLFCDGSVRFVKQEVDRRVLQGLGNRADGGLIGDDAF